jgi:hypothetical protein
MRAIAAAATAPAMIADQVTPDVETSPALAATGRTIVVSIIFYPRLVVKEKGEKDDDRDGNAE